MYDSRILIIVVQILTNSFWVQILQKSPHLKWNHPSIFQGIQKINENYKIFRNFRKIGNFRTFRHDFVKVSILNYHLNGFLIYLNDSKYIYGI